MVCDRCIRVVREELERAGYNVAHVALGEATINAEKPVDLPAIRRILVENGFELIEDKNAKIIEQVKASVIALVRSGDHPGKKQKLSVVLARDLGMEYTRLSALFSSVENITIEHTIDSSKINSQRTPRAVVTLSEIAYRSATAASSTSQSFRSVTGLPLPIFARQKALPASRLTILQFLPCFPSKML
jgi:hypothetical protein